MKRIIQEPTSTGPVSSLNSSSIGKKLLMAVSGLIAVAYLAGHMIGNLQIFLGQNQINAYAHGLHSLGPMLWVVRGFLIIFLALHVWKGIQLKLENWSARPVKYAKNTTVQASLASRTMIWTGVFIFAFLIYHIMHYTVRSTNPEFNFYVDALGRADVYRMVIEGFTNPVIAIFYVVAVGLACFHLSHAFSSMFQSVGWTTPKMLKRLEALGTTVAVILFLGFAAVPVAVLTKFITYTMGGH